MKRWTKIKNEFYAENSFLIKSKRGYVKIEEVKKDVYPKNNWELTFLRYGIEDCLADKMRFKDRKKVEKFLTKYFKKEGK